LNSSTEKRLYPRISCRVPIASSDAERQLEGLITNLSLTGMRIQTASALRLGERYAFGFNLPSNTKPISVELRALHVCLHEPSQPETYGFRIENLAQRDVRQIKQFILEQMSVDQRRVIQKAFKHLSTTVITPFTQRAKVEELLARAMASSAVFTLVQEDKPQAVNCLLQDVSVHGLTFRAADDDARGYFDVRVPVILAFSMEFNAYHGETVVTALEGDCIVVEFPKTLFFSEKRSRERETIPAAGKVLLEIALPYPKGSIIQREVLDLSSTGLSFRTSASETYFLPGTPLRQLRIVSDGKRILDESGEVKYVAPMIEDCESESLKIGVEFLTQQPAIVLTKNTVKVEERTGEERRAGSRRSNDRRAGERRQNMLENLSEFTRKIASQGLQLYRKGWQAPVEPNSDAEIGIVRYANRRNEEIVAIVNSTGDGRRRLEAPVVIIPPAYGRRKESTGALAMTLVENFRRMRRDLVVLRFDGVRSIGESYKDRTCRYEGKEMINMTLSQGMEDIQTTLDYVQDNPNFRATETILISFSLSACMARKAILADTRQRVSYWLSAWGSPDAQSTIRNSTGGVDFIGNYQRGISCGVTNVLGHLIDNDRFCSDAIRSGMAFLEDAKRDMAKISVPVTWLYGRYDEWIDPKRIREIMRVKAPGTREVLELSTGHMPTTSDEAMEAYLLITGRIWRHLFREEIEIRKPSATAAIRLRNAEWSRTPKHSLKDQADYWEKYLLGQGHLEVGFDVMAETEEHQQFMREQIKRLDIRRGESVADFGGGTGLFHQSLLGLDQTRQLFEESEPHRPIICSVDFVEAALEKSKARVSRLAAEHGVVEASFIFQLASLEVSRFKPIWRFLNGHFFSVEKLKGKIEGLPDYSIDLWLADYSEFLHAVLRGKQLDVTDVHRLNKEFALGETEILLEMNLAARFVRRRLEARDFCDPRTFKALLGADLLDYSKVNAGHLNFKKLKFRGSTLNLDLDFQTGQFDKMLCSIVLSYLFNPLESLLEFERILKPGGRLVISTFRPDVDMSRIYTRLIQKIEGDPFYRAPNGMTREDFLNAVRAFANSAAFLLQLEEEGCFKFFSREEFRDLLEEAGFKNILLSDSFGKPHQAYVAVCTK
jgi:ubiquinone/menaquinone biosynthesis C-methylase UbiE/pimeloyl-ACP methyl ester carboxylesterase